MLTLEQVKTYFPKETANKNIKGMLVEYLQCEFLDSMFKVSRSEYLSFIGGTAIRIIYNSQRFSEDLDFDNFGLDFKQFEEITAKTCREMQVKGFNLEWRSLKKDNVFHCYIKFPSIFGEFGVKAHHLAKIFLAVDAETKRKVVKPEIFTINRFGVFRSVPTYDPSVLLSQKLIAIINRKRQRGRDFYDASFLSGIAKPDYAYIKSVAGAGKEKFKEKLMKICRRLDYKALSKDVEPFLFAQEQKQRILSFNKNLPSML